MDEFKTRSSNSFTNFRAASNGTDNVVSRSVAIVFGNNPLISFSKQ
jgi:hypothetical protein